MLRLSGSLFGAVFAVVFSSASLAVGNADYAFIKRNALPVPPGLTPQTICDTNNMQDVEAYDGTRGVSPAYVNTNQTSTLQLQWLSAKEIKDKLPGFSSGNIPNVRWCTGTLLANNRVLTAGHCFDKQDGSTGWYGPNRLAEDGSLQYASPELNATVMKVNFNYQKIGTTDELRPDDSYPIVRLLEYREGNDKLDFAVFEVGKNAQGQLPFAIYQIARTNAREPVSHETISIIQHPAGMPKKIDAGSFLSRYDNFMFYSNVDTMGGSSGSGVRDANGIVIGVHTNGGCIKGVQNDKFANRGVTLQAISEVSGIF